jgi:membrane protease YdiL (CAAX protease family)
MIRALKEINWKVFGILLAGGLLGVLAILPFASDLVRTMPLGESGPSLPMPLIVALALVQNGLLLAVTIMVGLILAPRVGLTMPLFESWANGNPAPAFAGTALRAFGAGAAAGAAIIAVEVVFFLQYLSPSMRTYFDIPLWKRLLSGVVYGGVTEELLMRLFLLSFVTWLLGRWWKTPEGKPTAGAFWTAIVIVALLFGLGHLPATALMAPLTPPLILRALVLNGLAGTVFGYLYWRHGLEAAMLGHMSAHLVMQVPGVMLVTRML